jgi:choline monooxygenase
MFQSDTHLPHVLPPAAYHDPAQFAAETERLLWPAWHCVGSTADFPRVGSRLPVNLLGLQLNLERTWRGIRVSAIGDRCRRMRDSESASAVRVDTVGSLVFVSLMPAGISLQDYLGPHADHAAGLFSTDWQRCLLARQLIPANWKALVENILESYHLETVHVKTFRAYPPSEACFHEMEPGWSSYTERNESEHSHLKRTADTLGRMLGVQPHPHYRHVIIYPHFVMARMGLFNWAQTIVPIGPRQSLNLWQFFMLRGTRQTPAALAAAFVLRRWARRFFATALDEDGCVLANVQAGLEAADHPRGGLISAREERIFHFQRHVLERTGAVPAHDGMALTG